MRAELPEPGEDYPALLLDLVARIRASAEGRRPVVLIDGRSGAGKSTLATPLARALEATLVRLDDIYPGWDGLEDGARAVSEEILPTSRWRQWDWANETEGPLHRIDPGRALVVEGCGALTRGSRAAATTALWIELDADERRRRAIGRDGEAYAPHWERWARQEERLYARERPDLLADIVLDGTAIPIEPPGQPSP